MNTLTPASWRALREWGLTHTLHDCLPSQTDAADWYGLRSHERAAPLTELGRRVLRFQIAATTTLTSRLS